MNGQEAVVLRRLDALAAAIRERASWEQVEWHYDHARSAVERALGTRERRRYDFCHAVLHHGPGHQSATLCDVRGPHSTVNGQPVHRAVIRGNEVAQWLGAEGRTGFFDEILDI